MNDKHEILNPKQYQNSNAPNPKRYDLEERTMKYAIKVREYARKLRKSITSLEIIDQMFRAASSVGANYIEANEALGRKDFIMRIRICRKEAKESIYWIQLTEPTAENCQEKAILVQEGTELMKIFGSIVVRCAV